MAVYYGDSSALAKRYIREVGSAWIITLTEPAARNRIYTAQVTGVEIVAALSRRVRTGSMTQPAATVALAAFRDQFWTRYRRVRVTNDVLERAMDLAERRGLRGYDAVQLACALAARDRLVARGLRALIFLSADDELTVAATAEGLPVDNPNFHP